MRAGMYDAHNARTRTMHNGGRGLQMDELKAVERSAAAWEFAGENEEDVKLAYDTASEQPGEIILDEGERRITVWLIDGTYVLTAAWAPSSDGDPVIQTLVLRDWR